MKSLTMLTLGLAALTAIPATAQEAKEAKLQAYAVIGNKALKINLDGSPGKGKFTYTNDGQQFQMDVAKCKMFYMLTPADMAAALNEYQSNHLAEARKKLAGVKGHYAHFAGLHGNPATTAAMLELDCAARMLDWAAVKKLSHEVPGTAAMDEHTANKLKVLRIMGEIKDSAASLKGQREDIAKLLKETKRAIDIENYGWLRYALARAYEAQVADMIEGGITDEKKADAASKAIDNYCQAALASHGTRMEIPLDAMQRALRLLWAMPGVRDFAAGASPMVKGTWDKAPVDFKDAVVLAYMLKNVYTTDGADSLEQKDLIEKLSKLYYNAEKDRKPEKKEEAKG